MTHEKKVKGTSASHTTEVVDNKKSNKQHLDALDEQSTRLCNAVQTFEKNVKTVEADIHKLNIQLDESRMMCVSMTDVVAILPDLQEEIKVMRLQLCIFYHVVDNG
ncbi:Uncharacterized protein Adt_03738 [Abeliophyllum distichum]|uniref:Uncharacterized protein n=1 Tax=Abeliophyllum distichum TaxID=126358 RepID=A0ABD1VZB8_9LAMI